VFFITHNHPEEEVRVSSVPNAVPLALWRRRQQEMFVTVYQTRCLFISECLTFCQHYCENLNSFTRGPLDFIVSSIIKCFNWRAWGRPEYWTKHLAHM
jgi:hypothetical protein